MADVFPEGLPNPNWGLSQGAEFRVSTVKFADGYEQRRPKGINSTVRSWRLSWSLLEKEEKDTIVDFLLEKKGVEAFLWDVPEGERVRVVCKKPPKFEFSSYSNYSVSAEFSEDFGF